MEQGTKSYTFRGPVEKMSAINSVADLYDLAKNLWHTHYTQTVAETARKSRLLLVPPSFQGRFKINIEHLIDVVTGAKTAWRQTIAGDPTEEKFYTFFANELSNAFTEQAILIHGFNFHEALVQYFQSLEPDFVIKAFECDFLVISEEYGAIICEVKHVSSTKEARYKEVWDKALKQTNNIDQFLRWLSARVGEVAPVSKIFIYETNIDDAERWFARQQSETKAFRTCLNLAKIDGAKFAKWWCQTFGHTKSKFQTTKLIELLSVLRGLQILSRHQLKDFKSRDFSPAGGATSTVHDINSQNYYTKKPANRIPSSPLEHQNIVIYLSPSQQKVLNGPLRQIIIGNPGSGKTLLVEIKAIDLVKRGAKVLIIAPNPQISAYELAFSTKFAGDRSYLNRVTFYTYPRNTLPPSAESVVNVFIDEAATYVNRNTVQYVNDLAAKVKGFYWVVSLPYGITGGPVWYGLCSSENKGYLSMWKYWLEYIRKDHDFHVKVMPAVLRNTKQIAEAFLQLQFNGDREKIKGLITHNISGPSIKIYDIWKLGLMPDIKLGLLPDHKLPGIATALLNDIAYYTSPVGGGFKLSDIGVLCLSMCDVFVAHYILSTNGIPNNAYISHFELGLPSGIIEPAHQYSDPTVGEVCVLSITGCQSMEFPVVVLPITEMHYGKLMWPTRSPITPEPIVQALSRAKYAVTILHSDQKWDAILAQLPNSYHVVLATDEVLFYKERWQFMKCFMIGVLFEFVNSQELGRSNPGLTAESTCTCTTNSQHRKLFHTIALLYLALIHYYNTRIYPRSDIASLMHLEIAANSYYIFVANILKTNEWQHNAFSRENAVSAAKILVEHGIRCCLLETQCRSVKELMELTVCSFCRNKLPVRMLPHMTLPLHCTAFKIFAACLIYLRVKQYNNCHSQMLIGRVRVFNSNTLPKFESILKEFNADSTSSPFSVDDQTVARLLEHCSIA